MVSRRDENDEKVLGLGSWVLRGDDCRLVFIWASLVGMKNQADQGAVQVTQGELDRPLADQVTVQVTQGEYDRPLADQGTVQVTQYLELI